LPDHLSGGIDPESRCENRAWKIDNCEGSVCRQNVSVGGASAVHPGTNDVATRIEPESGGRSRDGSVDGHESPIHEEEAVCVAVRIIERSDDPPVCGDRARGRHFVHPAPRS